MIDSFVLLAPILLLAIIGLLGFAGCNWAFGVKDTRLLKYLYRTNCGGPAIADADLGWSPDLDPSPAGGGALQNSGSPVIDRNTGDPALDIYNTCRVGGPGLTYQYMVGEGSYTVTLKFAQISDNPNLLGPFAFKIDWGQPPKIEEDNFDVVARAGNPLTTYDYQVDMTVKKQAAILTITFSEALDHGNFPFVNAIEIRA